eukprot:s850_g9.t1
MTPSAASRRSGWPNSRNTARITRPAPLKRRCCVPAPMLWSPRWRKKRWSLSRGCRTPRLCSATLTKSWRPLWARRASRSPPREDRHQDLDRAQRRESEAQGGCVRLRLARSWPGINEHVAKPGLIAVTLRLTVALLPGTTAAAGAVDDAVPGQDARSEPPAGGDAGHV